MHHVVTLETLCGGAASERVNLEIDRVLANVADINTDPEAVRTITMKIKIKPDRNRKLANIELSTESKLPGLAPVRANAWFGKQGGKPVLVEDDPKQLGLDINPAAPATPATPETKAL